MLGSNGERKAVASEMKEGVNDTIFESEDVARHKHTQLYCT